MPFDVVFNIVYDQQRVLLEQSKPQRVGNADLFCSRPGAHRAVEQISFRLCALSALFTLFSHQACASNLSPMRCRGSLGNSTILFSSTKEAVAILLVSFVRSPAILVRQPRYGSGARRSGFEDLQWELARHGRWYKSPKKFRTRPRI
jgi:hypothetical protein